MKTLLYILVSLFVSQSLMAQSSQPEIGISPAQPLTLYRRCINPINATKLFNTKEWEQYELKSEQADSLWVDGPKRTLHIIPSRDSKELILKAYRNGKLIKSLGINGFNPPFWRFLNTISSFCLVV